HKTVLTSSEIGQVLVEMGPVEGASDDASREQTAGTTAYTEPPRSTGAPRRLYRIEEGAGIGGVCNGIAAFLGVDVNARPRDLCRARGHRAGLEPRRSYRDRLFRHDARPPAREHVGGTSGRSRRALQCPGSDRSCEAEHCRVQRSRMAATAPGVAAS